MKTARGALRKNIPGYAGGGFIDGLKRAVGMAPAETMREKFARQDAERMAKQAPPVPKPVMTAPEGQTAVTSYAAGTLTGDRKKQMEDAIGKKVGGAIRGKGTGTSDEIPIMASNGEFMIKASSVKKIGIEALEALNAIGDQPDEKDSPAEAAREYGDAESSAEDKTEPKGAEKAGYKCGGAVRKKMAAGGLVDPANPDPNAVTPTVVPAVAPTAPAAAPVAAAPVTQNPLYTPGSAQDPKASVNIVAGSKSPFAGPTLGEQAIATPPPKPQGALRTPSLMATAPAAVASTPAIPPIQPPVIKMFAGGPVDEAARKALLAQIPTGGTGAGPTPQPDPTQSASGTELGRNVNNAINAIPAGTLGRGLVSGGVKVADALVNSERIGRVAAGAVRAMPYAVPVAAAGALGIASSQATPTTQAQAAPVPPAGTVAQPSTPVAAPVTAPAVDSAPVAQAPAQPSFDPLAAKAARDEQTQKDIALGNQMEATRKSNEADAYAAQDRGIDTSIAIAAKVDAERARQRAENTLSSTTDNAATRAQKAAATQTLGALDQQASQTAGNEAAARRSTQADATTRRDQDLRAQGQAVQAGALRANQKMAQDKFAQDSKGAAIDQQGKVQIQALQNALLAEQDPAKRQLIEDNLRAVQGKYEKAVPQKYTVYNLPDTVDANGNVVRGGQGALDADGRPIDIRPPKAQPQFETGKVYTDAKGNRAKWDGKTFVPA